MSACGRRRGRWVWTGLEECLLEAVTELGNDQIVFILDFHHARDHVVEFAKVLCEDESSRTEQARL